RRRRRTGVARRDRPYDRRHGGQRRRAAPVRAARAGPGLAAALPRRRGEAVKARLSAIPASHPSFAAQLMLERKGIEYSRVDLPQWFHRGLLRVVRFRARTVPALVLDGRRVHTTPRIARVLDEVQPSPP